MKILSIKNNITFYLNTLISVVILTIPLYALRLTFVNTSVSVLTISMFILSTILLIIYHKNIFITLKKEPLLWTFALLFVISFIPSLLLNFTVHGSGVFIEWIFLPALTSFLIYIHTTKNSHAYITIQTALSFTLFIVSIIALIYFILNIKTFDDRLTAFYPSPNHLAFFIAPLIPIAIAQFLNTKHILFKIFLLVTLLSSVLTLFLTNSFISSISIIVALMFITFVHTQKKQLLLISLFLFFIFLSIVSFHKITNIEISPVHNPLFSRIEIWTVATYQIQNNPLLNTHPIDDFQQIYLDAQPLYTPYNTWSAPTPHNLILTLWISGGFFTVLFFCLICARSIYFIILSYTKTKSTTILFYLAALLTILLTGIFDTSFWKNDLSFLLWLIIILGINQKFAKIYT